MGKEMYWIERNTGRTELWVGKKENNYEHRYGKYEIYGLLKIVGFVLSLTFSFILGATIF